MKTLNTLSTVLLLAMFSGYAVADIKLKTIAEMEVKKTNAKGEVIIKREAVKTAVPGTEIIYTIKAKNTGNQNATSVVVTNPVPKQMIYVDGSAFGAGTDITFSVDGGKKYAKPNKLTVKDKDGKDVPATAKDYTNVRWTFTFALKPGQEAPVWYRARVK